jgi:hypothetical protein
MTYWEMNYVESLGQVKRENIWENSISSQRASCTLLSNVTLHRKITISLSAKFPESSVF